MHRKTESKPSNVLDIYVHVPKTAGTSLHDIIMQHYGRHNVYMYSAGHNQFFPSDHRPVRRENPNSVKFADRFLRLPAPIISAARHITERFAFDDAETVQRASAIVGHFAVDSFDRLDIARPVRQFTVVREPLARMISHYRYLHQRQEAKARLASWLTDADPSLSFPDFALGSNVQNFQIGYTGTDPSRFAVIGNSERLNDFLLAAGLKVSADEIPHHNQGTWHDASAFDCLHDAGFVREFEQFHDLDYAFYRQSADLPASAA